MFQFVLLEVGDVDQLYGILLMGFSAFAASIHTREVALPQRVLVLDGVAQHEFRRGVGSQRAPEGSHFVGGDYDHRSFYW